LLAFALGFVPGRWDFREELQVTTGIAAPGMDSGADRENDAIFRESEPVARDDISPGEVRFPTEWTGISVGHAIPSNRCVCSMNPS
jgi:hypothetical protein